MSEQELKPCLRCGGAAVYDEPYPGDYNSGAIHCDDCGLWMGEDMDRDEAIEWWNTQPLVSRLQARITELEAQLADVRAMLKHSPHSQQAQDELDEWMEGDDDD